MQRFVRTGDTPDQHVFSDQGFLCSLFMYTNFNTLAVYSVSLGQTVQNTQTDQSHQSFSFPP